MSLLGEPGIVLLALLGCTGLIVALAPAALTVGRWQVRRPRTALALWCVAVGAGLGTALGGVGLALALAFGDSAGGGGVQSILVTLLGVGALAALVVFTAGVGTGSETVLHAEGHNRDLLLGLAHDTYPLDAGCDLVVLNHDAPLACALPGERSVVAVSDRLLRELSASELRAVIAHERAHLQGRHHLLTRLADLHALWLPRFWTTRPLRRAVTLLVELAADDRAARVAGPAALANALVDLGAQLQDPALGLRAERLARRRHHRQRHGLAFPWWEVRPAAAASGPTAELHQIPG